MLNTTLCIHDIEFMNSWLCELCASVSKLLCAVSFCCPLDLPTCVVSQQTSWCCV